MKKTSLPTVINSLTTPGQGQPYPCPFYCLVQTPSSALAAILVLDMSRPALEKIIRQVVPPSLVTVTEPPKAALRQLIGKEYPQNPDHGIDCRDLKGSLSCIWLIGLGLFCIFSIRPDLLDCGLFFLFVPKDYILQPMPSDSTNSEPLGCFSRFGWQGQPEPRLWGRGKNACQPPSAQLSQALEHIRYDMNIRTPSKIRNLSG